MSKENIIELIKGGNNYSEVARLYGCSREWVRQVACRFGIDIKKLKKKNPELYSRINYHAYACPVCKKIFYSVENDRVFCSCKCYGKNASKIYSHNLQNNKEAGRIRHKLSYREKIKAHLGREIGRDEVVHHIDGNLLNNDISNLAVMSRAEHGKFHTEKYRLTNEIARDNFKT